jgi:polysaccharide pyruvyl transferase WcaK-like protein
MRILIATGLNAGSAEYKNLGDVGMLQAAVTRLRSLWPRAILEVLTDSPADLDRHCPGVKAVPRSVSLALVGPRAFLGRVHRRLPGKASAAISGMKGRVDTVAPRLLELAVQSRLAIRDTSQRDEFRIFLDALCHADLLVVSGSGGFADSCREWNLAVLGTMAAAMRRGVPVVMFGQGMGPLTDQIVLSSARRVLPKADFIALRGTAGGFPLLQLLGVDCDRVVTTGDDTIEMAYESRVDGIGTGIGVNLRMAFYAGVDGDRMRSVKLALQQFARRKTSHLLPVPIALHEVANDAATIRELLRGFDDESDGGSTLDTPSKIIRQISRCRIVVTGAYHAAVFALAQGISTVCLANSSYYLKKFEGLRVGFEGGCQIVNLESQGAPEAIMRAMASAWNSAEVLRPKLLQAAAQQAEQGRAAYKQMKALLDGYGRNEKPVSRMQFNLRTIN